MADASQNFSTVFSLYEKRLCEHVCSGDTTPGVGGSPSQALGKHKVEGCEGSMGSGHEELGTSALPRLQAGGDHSQ